MAFKMGVDPETTKAPKPVPAGQYDIILKDLRCKLNKAKDSYNYNATFEVTNNKSDYNGTKVYFLMPTKGSTAGRKFVDFCHALGFPLNPDGSFPGSWDYPANCPKIKILGGEEGPDPEKAQYKGVLMGKIAKAELATKVYEGNESNEVKQFMCKIPDCATKFLDVKHLTDMSSKDK